MSHQRGSRLEVLVDIGDALAEAMLSSSEGSDFSCRAELVRGVARSEASAEMSASAWKII